MRSYRIVGTEGGASIKRPEEPHGPSLFWRKHAPCRMTAPLNCTSVCVYNRVAKDRWPFAALHEVLRPAHWMAWRR